MVIVNVLLFCVYFHAAAAKVNEDWLRGEPLRHWLPKREGRLGSFIALESTAYMMSYAGIIYDAIAVPLMVYKPTRPIGMAFSIFFHLSNKLIFSIGIFPWMMIAMDVIYVSDPNQPVNVISEAIYGKEDGLEVEQKKKKKTGKVVNRKKKKKKEPLPSKLVQKLVVLAIVIFFCFQFFFPLRHYMIPGDVAWNEYGHLYSWRMKLRDKNCNIYSVEAEIREPSGTQRKNVQNLMSQLYSQRQIKTTISRPDLLSQVAHNIKDILLLKLAKKNGKDGDFDVKVFFDIKCQLNFRPLGQFTDPTKDVTAEPAFQWPYSWLISDPPPLPESAKKDLPWNFEWTFSWIRTFPKCHLKDNNALYEELRMSSTGSSGKVF
eukprot:CAMPEP_0201490266 /NCGR_PEP_ID=MMETSP0151_2-20130828/25855_1 /ASSEMBLY_ACC=CAM_ASM_000257 /TAXON_ID=200890 /ORGANISM="Paramoeba atlantica, Strain 621/1 / CCAP 1560/9" /LENGTH=374 /DNA_ID=CAMNT_0047876165 /DNA_START=500 /DNA_END=1625 /DNA_ORIENTATION=+